MSNEVIIQNTSNHELHPNDNETENLSTVSSNNSQKKVNIDTIIDKIGYTKYHIIMLIIVSLIFFIDGCEMIIINLFLTTLKDEWGLSPKEKSLLSSSVFIGFFLGSMFSGYLTNIFGRRIPSIFGSLLVFISTSFAAFSTQMNQMVIIRIFIGLGIGIFVPATTCLITELIPKKGRSFVLNIIWILFPIGSVYICLISILYTDEHDVLLWRKVFQINSLGAFFISILSFFLYESPRYYLLIERYDKAFCILEKMGKFKLTEIEKQDIINENRALKNLDKGLNGIFFLFNEKYLLITIILSSLWFIGSFISYGILYILPKLFDGIYISDKKESISHTMKAMSILAFCPIFRGIISEIKLFGRKNTIIMGFFGTVFFGIICSIIKKNNEHLSLYSGLLKFCINTSLGITSIYTCEIYPTKYRSLALGFGNALTKLGSIMTPFICEYISDFYSQSPFYLFITFGVLGGISCYFLPYETCGMALDEVGKELKKKKEK